MNTSISILDNDLIELIGALEIQGKLFQSPKGREDQQIVQANPECDSRQRNTVGFYESVDAVQSSGDDFWGSATNPDPVNFELLRKGA